MTPTPQSTMDPMPVRFYVVLPGLGRVPGIYDDIDDARKQTDGISRAPSGFDSLDLAVRYWRSHVPDKPPPMHLRWTSAEDDGDPSAPPPGRPPRRPRSTGSRSRGPVAFGPLPPSPRRRSCLLYTSPSPRDS